MKRLGLSLLTFFSLLHAEDSLDINTLLTDIEKKSDLSEKTKLENSGISLVYTRDDLDRMQAKYLKDILISSTTYGYRENRYSAPDPFNRGDLTPFVSSAIRIFIDNQEILGGVFASGLANLGDIDISFVDHIEIYTQTPTYEYSTEPTFMLIKLYTKSALKDEGSKVEMSYASRGATRITAYTANELNNDWNCFTYATYDNLKREKYNSFGTALSRDKKRTHLITTLNNDNHRILFENINFTTDAFAGSSLDATPLISTLNVNNLHIGYDAKINNFSYGVDFDQHILKYNFLDNPGSYIYSKTSTTTTNILSADANYKFHFLKNEFIAGAKYRTKRYKLTNDTKNNKTQPKRGNNHQDVATFFIQNIYSVMKNLVLTGGVQYVNVKNPNAKYNNGSDILGYRLALTYVTPSWTLKTVASHSETYLEPFLIDSDYVSDKDLKNYTVDFIYEDIIYTLSSDKFETIFGYLRSDNYLLPNDQNGGKLDNYTKTLSTTNALFRWTHEYRRYDKLFIDLSYQDVHNLPSLSIYTEYKAILRTLNTFNKIDLFNELIGEYDNSSKKHSFTYNLALKYRYSDSLSFAFKGENIFDKAPENSYMRIQFTKTGVQNLGSLYAPSYDRRAIVSMEYLF